MDQGKEGQDNWYVYYGNHGDLDHGHLAPGRADYEQAFEGLNLITEKISGTLFEISGALAKALATP